MSVSLTYDRYWLSTIDSYAGERRALIMSSPGLSFEARF